MDKCMYCGTEINDDREVTVCDICGEKVWGTKMFNTIKRNMHEAREKGDLCHDRVFVEDVREVNEGMKL
jgi:hypothetical protein